jgi:hypothetical protein
LPRRGRTIEIHIAESDDVLVTDTGQITGAATGDADDS